MSNSLRLGILIVGLSLVATIILTLKKGRIPTKYALIWLLPAFAIVILATIPSVFIYFSRIIGFETISSLFVGMIIVILFLIIIALTVLIAGLNTKVTLLIQEISILKTKDK